MESLFTWFGYVGSCLATPDATCRPFLAFILMGAAASAALTLVIMRYRAVRARETAASEEHLHESSAAESRERVRRAVAAGSPAPHVAIQRRYRPVV